MSSGATHDKITIVAGIAIAITAYYFLGWYIATIVTSAFLFSGFAFNGDLDIYSDPYKRWCIIRYIWIPYRRFGHRSFWTHGFLAGTIVRLLWIAPLILVGTYASGVWFLVPAFIVSHWQECMWAVAGLEAGSMSHTWADMTSSTWKKMF